MLIKPISSYAKDINSKNIKKYYQDITSTLKNKSDNTNKYLLSKDNTTHFSERCSIVKKYYGEKINEFISNLSENINKSVKK